MGYTLSIIGCGTMGHAILSGITTHLDSSPTATATASDLPTTFIATVGRPSSVPPLAHAFPDRLRVLSGDEGNLAAIRDADIVLLACKPYMARGILQAPGVGEALQGKVLVSVLAGVTCAQLQEWAGEGCQVVRTMTNTPAKIGQGMTLLTPLPPSATLSRLTAIFTTCGRVLTVPEPQFDACTALAGSGPAFVAVMIDALADGGVLMGLGRAVAVELAAQTMRGTAEMVLGGAHPAVLKDGVTTPGGCTIAGLMRMEDGNVRATLARTVQAAAMHAKGLGQEKK